MKSVIAVVSEEKAFVDSFTVILEGRGKEVVQFSSITHSMHVYADTCCSMIILGVKSLDDCVIKLIENLHSVGNAPILVCYEQASEEQRVTSLDNGVTACVNRGVSMRECSAIIDALIRVYAAFPSKENGDVLSFRNGLVIDKLNWSVWMNGMPIKLTRREYFALRFLAQNKNKIMTRKEIYCRQKMIMRLMET